jgi:hypothetical protein
MLSNAAGNRPLPRRLIQATALRTPESRIERVDRMKEIVLRTAIILLGTMAYVGVGMALASAG